MRKAIKIEIESGPTLYADLLWTRAPATCAAIAADLPYREKTLGHAKWSGSVISAFSSSDFCGAECTCCLGVAPGDILYNPHVHDAAEHPNEISLVYGPAAMRTFSGYALANLFARVRPAHLETLAALGEDINRHGERTAAFTLVEETGEGGK